MPNADSTTSGIDWRTVAGWFFLLMGGMLVIFSLGAFVWIYPQEHIALKRILSTLVFMLICGMLWVYAGLKYLHGDLTPAIIMTIIGFALVIYGNLQNSQYF